MNLAAVMDEVAAVLETISGLRVTAWPPGTVTPPAGAVSYPELVEFDQTYGRGCDKITGLPFLLVAGLPTERSARDAVSTWAAGSGAGSVKAAMESHAWTSCDDLTVARVEFDVVQFAGVDYLAAMFSADVIGSA